MAKRTWFYPEVRLLLGRERINVNSLEQAAQILMSDDWPLHDRTCERAAETLIKALLGDVDIDEARQAFEAAAKEARILVR
ncbi:DUF982 domain-containing protein [Allomesorhizobium camelthorni]|uniref:DUF982 domain-containing protein n=1 Tax=Allomesorhizobium camelthorni TaxID=475069 RepID=A0A6G4W9Z8_9HYPH|nr:DUF982 domain-containing protein [Mesorhizobium camelthorni]NGO51591.1 DUF982 domain-containing protein [Mesorhizobium camelthorni]